MYTQCLVVFGWSLSLPLIRKGDPSNAAVPCIVLGLNMKISPCRSLNATPHHRKEELPSDDSTLALHPIDYCPTRVAINMHPAAKVVGHRACVERQSLTEGEGVWSGVRILLRLLEHLYVRSTPRYRQHGDTKHIVS